MIRLNLFLLGAPRVERNGKSVDLSRRKVLALLIYLAVTRQPQRRDTLATLFWPDSGQEAARASLRRELYTLTSALGEGWIESDREQVTLAAQAAIAVDVEQFRDHLSATRTHGHVPDEVCNACLEPLTAAVALYQGDFLAGFTLSDCPEFDDWQFFHTDSLRRELTGALEKLVRLHRERGEYETAISYARRWLLVDSLHEPVHRLLMQLYAWAGQQTAALRQYQECVRLLNEELGVEPEPETAAIFEAIRARRFPEPEKPKADKVTRWQGDKVTSEREVPSSLPHPVTSSPRHNLPSQPTPFIGREQEVAAILDRLQDPDCRLLTLVGPGGMGKTRLALQAAQTILDSSVDAAEHDNPKSKIQNRKFEDGVFFVSLEAVQAPSGIITAIADALGLRLVSNSAPQQQLLDHLRPQQRLLVLDNFEQLLTPTLQTESTELIAALLAAAPYLKMLITSREALNLREEWFHQIGGLAYPTDELSNTDLTQGADAILLFDQCARRANQHFSLASATEQNQVLRICRLVEGMPLALELAAAWLKVLRVEEVADEIERNLDILTARHQNAPGRHRSMRVVLEQSWQRLDAHEQAILARLAVFQGGFRQAAAEKVAGASLLTLAAFVEKSLLRLTETGRYQMHELLRQFLAEKLVQTPTAQTQAHVSHCHYYAYFVTLQEAKFTTGQGLAALLAVKDEADNIRTGWLYAIAAGGTLVVSALGDYAWSLCLYYAWRCWPHEGIDLFRRAATCLEAAQPAPTDPQHPLVLGRVYLGLGLFHYYLSDLTATSAVCQRCLQLLEDETVPAAGFQRDAGMARQLIGLLANQRGDYAEAATQLTASLHWLRSANQLLFAAGTQVSLGVLAYDQGDYTQAAHYLSASLEILVAGAENRYRAVALGYVGRLANQHHSPQFAEIIAQLRAELVVIRPLGDAWALTQMLYQLGALLALAAQSEEQRSEAQMVLYESLTLRQTIGDRIGQAFVHNQLGWLMVAGADRQAAQLHWRTALTIAQQLQFPKIMLEAIYGLACLLPDDPPDAQSTWLWLIITHPASDWYTRQGARELLTQVAPPALSADESSDTGTQNLDQVLATIATAILSGAITLSNPGLESVATRQVMPRLSTAGERVD
jgi:DNA-binding SARP family transcriptional activator/predicted ATPase